MPRRTTQQEKKNQKHKHHRTLANRHLLHAAHEDTLYRMEAQGLWHSAFHSQHRDGSLLPILWEQQQARMQQELLPAQGTLLVMN